MGNVLNTLNRSITLPPLVLKDLIFLVLVLRKYWGYTIGVSWRVLHFLFSFFGIVLLLLRFPALWGSEGIFLISGLGLPFPLFLNGYMWPFGSISFIIIWLFEVLIFLARTLYCPFTQKFQITRLKFFIIISSKVNYLSFYF